MPGDVRQTVRREFDRLLMDEERDRDARIDDACKRDARIGELLKKRTLTMTNAYAQALSDHRAPDRDAIRAEYARIDAEIAARLNALNLPGDYLQMRYRCPVCHDLGYVGDAGRHDCECFRARLDEERRKRARLDMAGDDTFEAFNADIFSPEPLPGLGYSQRDFMLRVKKLCMAYCDEFPNNRKRSLIFTGAPGLGKTFLLNCMANQLYSRGVGVSYLTAYRMLGAMRESFLETNTEPFNIMIDAELLMIDDLGSEPDIPQYNYRNAVHAAERADAHEAPYDNRNQLKRRADAGALRRPRRVAADGHKGHDDNRLCGRRRAHAAQSVKCTLRE